MHSWESWFELGGNPAVSTLLSDARQRGMLMGQDVAPADDVRSNVTKDVQPANDVKIHVLNARATFKNTGS